MNQKLINSLKLVARYELIVMNDGFICMPTIKNLIIFESFNGKEINDNPYAIYQQLITEQPKLIETCYFSVKPSEYGRLKKKFPKIKMLKRFTPKWVRYIARAEYWVMNSRMPLWWKKNKQTTFIQTWHGTPLKKLGVDISNVEIPGTTTQKYHHDFTMEAKRWDYLIAPNEYSKEIFKSAFNYTNQFLDIGYPRNDVLYHDNNDQKISGLKKSILGKNIKHVIMYAPTWRDDNFKTIGTYNFTLPFSLKEFFKIVPEDYMLIIRPHYLVKDQIDISGYEDRVKILPDHDMNQLYLITDLLITDYSSVMFDFANLKRPMLFYSYDLDHYRDQLRGFYFNYDANTLPGPLVTDEQSFYKAIREYVQESGFSKYQVNLDEFNHKFCSWEDGKASEKVSNLILRGMNNEK